MAALATLTEALADPPLIAPPTGGKIVAAVPPVTRTMMSEPAPVGRIAAVWPAVEVRTVMPPRRSGAPVWAVPTPVTAATVVGWSSQLRQVVDQAAIRRARASGFVTLEPKMLRPRTRSPKSVGLRSCSVFVICDANEIADV